MSELRDRQLICTDCGKIIDSYFNVGYDGPANLDEFYECRPDMAWMTLCIPCDEARNTKNAIMPQLVDVLLALLKSEQIGDYPGLPWITMRVQRQTIKKANEILGKIKSGE